METTLSHNRRIASKYKGSRGRKACWSEDIHEGTFIPRYGDEFKEKRKLSTRSFLEKEAVRLNKEPFIIYETNKPAESVSKIMQAANIMGIKVNCVITIGGVKISLKE